MLLQLIMRNTEWYQYIINALIVIVGRTLDILSTRYVTKELKLETNKLAKKVGWRGTREAFRGENGRLITDAGAGWTWCLWWSERGLEGCIRAGSGGGGAGVFEARSRAAQIPFNPCHRRKTQPSPPLLWFIVWRPIFVAASFPSPISPPRPPPPWR